MSRLQRTSMGVAAKDSTAFHSLLTGRSARDLAWLPDLQALGAVQWFSREVGSGFEQGKRIERLAATLLRDDSYAVDETAPPTVLYERLELF